MMSIPVLETPRLRLRGFKNEDFERYAAMYAEPAVVRFISGLVLSHEAAWTRFLRQVGHWHQMGFGLFGIEDRATGAFLGEAGFHDLRRMLTPSIEGTLEAGWVLATEAHGKGLAEEAMRWSAPLRVDNDQAAVLPVLRMCCSSNCCGLR